MSGRAQRTDGHGPPERGRECLQAGKGRHPGADGPSSPQPEASAPAGGATGEQLRRQVQSRVHAVRPGGLALLDHPGGGGGSHGREEAPPAPGGLHQAAGRGAADAEELHAAVFTGYGGREASSDVETVVNC